MKNSDRRNRFDAQFVPNSKVIFTLPLNGKILQGKVILTGTVNITGGTTSGTKSAEGGPSNLVRRVIITATPAAGSRYPGGKVVDCSARGLLQAAVFQRRKYVAEQAGNVLGSGAIGNNTIYEAIPIFFADDNLRRGVECALNADPTAYQSITVEVDTGTLADCFTGNDRTVDYSGLHVQWADDRENMAGDTYVPFQEDHFYLIPAAQQRAQDKAMPQDGSFAQILIMAETTAQRNLADTILQRVTISGDALDYDKFAQDIRQQMIDDWLVDSSATMTGLYFIDFTDGLLGGTVAASGLDIKYQLANPGGANLDDLLVYTLRAFAPANYQASTGTGTGQNN